MADPDSYLYYEAGQAVAAIYLHLTIRHISTNPAHLPTDIVIPKDKPKARMILWLAGMAAERKAIGKSSPLRRMRNRMRIRAQVESIAADLPGPLKKRLAKAKTLRSQSQDRANAISINCRAAIERVAKSLRKKGLLSGQEVVALVGKTRGHKHQRKSPRPSR